MKSALGISEHEALTLFIWDIDGNPPAGNYITILWNSYGNNESETEISVPKLINQNPNPLRQKLLELFYQFENTIINDKRIVDHFELRSGLSMLWMIFPTLKSSYIDSPPIVDSIRFIAFDEWAKKINAVEIILVSSNKLLAKSLRGWSKSRGIKFKYTNVNSKKKSAGYLIRIYTLLPNVLKTLVWLINYLITRLALRGVGLRDWERASSNLTLISYLFKIGNKPADHGHFESPYWGNLSEVLFEHNIKTKWLHLYVRNSAYKTSKEAANVLRLLNKNSDNQQYHVALESFLSFNVILNSFLDWLRMIKVEIKIKRKLKILTRSSINIWPLFEEVWHKSIFGPEALANLINLSLFESALNKLPSKQKGVYLQENQPWEFGLIYAWRESGHSCIIGFPHSFARFWDLRYFFDSRNYVSRNRNKLPLPDRVAASGVAMMQAYVNGGYPKHAIYQVEALRYLYLEDMYKHTLEEPLNPKDPLRVLVFGEFLPKNTKRQMSILEKAIEIAKSKIIITVKSHPACIIKKEDYPKLHLRLTSEPMAEILTKCDVVYTGGVTSAAVDAYCAGVYVISLLNPGSLNLSPLAEGEKVFFVETPEDLLKAFLAIPQKPSIIVNKDDLFTIDKNLPRWLTLLEKS
jgi:surface carbohydrate biosynthesis protein (TIGR04326 family)